MKLSKEKLAQCRLQNAVKSKKIIKPYICENCYKKTKVEAHHEDYSKPYEVIWLCRRCHMAKDGRLEIFKSTCKGFNPQKEPPKQCVICKELKKPLRKSRCHACNEYFRRTGKERYIIIKNKEIYKIKNKVISQAMTIVAEETDIQHFEISNIIDKLEKLQEKC